MFKPYTGYEYVHIDIANQYGLDKLTFEDRIQWVKDNINNLEALAADVHKKKPLYIKAVMALRDAQNGVATGHLVAMDAVCSGIQIMSVLTGCIAGSKATGLVNPTIRADAYTEVTKAMESILGGSVNVSRDDAKQATMTAMYGSKDTPADIFAPISPEIKQYYKDTKQARPVTPELTAFYQAIKESRIEVDELAHSSFTYKYQENEGSYAGVSNVANMVHSVDAYILRSMHRRCNYNLDMIKEVARLLEIELIMQSMRTNTVIGHLSGDVRYYVEQYNRSTVADITILPYLTAGNIVLLSKQHLKALSVIVHGMLQYQPFELITIHDSFAAHSNNINWVRWQYKEILAELADSCILNDLLSQIYKQSGTFQKLSTNLSSYIRNSNYALT